MLLCVFRRVLQSSRTIRYTIALHHSQLIRVALLIDILRYGSTSSAIYANCLRWIDQQMAALQTQQIRTTFADGVGATPSGGALPVLAMVQQYNYSNFKQP
jgi:hypothetical protein